MFSQTKQSRCIESLMQIKSNGVEIQGKIQCLESSASTSSSNPSLDFLVSAFFDMQHWIIMLSLFHGPLLHHNVDTIFGKSPPQNPNVDKKFGDSILIVLLTSFEVVLLDHYVNIFLHKKKSWDFPLPPIPCKRGNIVQSFF